MKVTSFTKDMQSLPKPIRNKIRAVLSAEKNDITKLLNKVRSNAAPANLIKIDKVIRSQKLNNKLKIPCCFPDEYQTSENYWRLEKLELNTFFSYLEFVIRDNEERLFSLFSNIKLLNEKIFKRDFTEIVNTIDDIQSNFGCSFFLFKKRLWVYEAFGGLTKADLNLDDLNMPGVNKKQLLATSISNLYSATSTFLSIKHSLLNIKDNGIENRFTRDMLRTTFYPFASSEDDLSSLLQSALQSSLLDAITICSLNILKINKKKYHRIISAVSMLNHSGLGLDSLAALNISLGFDEVKFYRLSSAWYEIPKIREYRALNDIYYDDLERDYINLDDDIQQDIDNWIGTILVNELVYKKELTSHGFLNLKKIENEGRVSRTSILNNLIRKSGGNIIIDEDTLISLMSKTSDLDISIDVDCAIVMAKHAHSKLSKIIYYLLISKKSRSERHSHFLRRLIQDVVIEKHNGNLVEFVSSLASKSNIIAQFTYEEFTEDFLSKLTKIVTSAAQITDTRASLHKWMWELTGEQYYLDRARSLIIDSQINKVRNEIDDHRIYVDAVRFLDWIQSNLFKSLSERLSSIQTVSDIGEEAHQLIDVIERCFFEFCSNQSFGIASYLGRRIRHGTFKGNLLGALSQIEDTYSEIINSNAFVEVWGQWKTEFGLVIDEIIDKKLHICTKAKPDGLIVPSVLRDPVKREMAISCARDVFYNFNSNKFSDNAGELLLEYCWRFVEVDLKKINSFLKGKRSELVKIPNVSETPLILAVETRKEFERDLVKRINDKLNSMQAWFKRPAIAAPTASLELLYTAVVSEVRETFPAFDPSTEFEDCEDIEIFGAAYHVLYDAFFVVVYNAAKHGKNGGIVDRTFKILRDEKNSVIFIKISITSEAKPEDSDDFINSRLKVSSSDDIEYAQLSERRSGIRKLYQLGKSFANFKVEKLRCVDAKVNVSLSYRI